MFQKAIVLDTTLCDNRNSKVMASGDRGGPERSKGSFSGVMVMFYILFWGVFSQVYTIVKNH